MIVVDVDIPVDIIGKLFGTHILENLYLIDISYFSS